MRTFCAAAGVAAACLSRGSTGLIDDRLAHADRRRPVALDAPSSGVASGRVRRRGGELPDRHPDQSILIDPLLGDDPEPVWDLIDHTLGRALSILVTIPYHVRDAETIWRGRYEAQLEVTIWGHAAVAKRLGDASGFRELRPGVAAPGGVRAFAIGRPRRFEMPLYLPSQRALAFGDAVVHANGGLRVWAQKPLEESRARWYRERFIPTLRPLLDLDVERPRDAWPRGARRRARGARPGAGCRSLVPPRLRPAHGPPQPGGATSSKRRVSHGARARASRISSSRSKRRASRRPSQRRSRRRATKGQGRTVSLPAAAGRRLQAPRPPWDRRPSRPLCRRGR